MRRTRRYLQAQEGIIRTAMALFVFRLVLAERVGACPQQNLPPRAGAASKRGEQ